MLGLVDEPVPLTETYGRDDTYECPAVRVMLSRAGELVVCFTEPEYPKEALLPPLSAAIVDMIGTLYPLRMPRLSIA